MTTIKKGRMTIPHRVDVCAVGCEAGLLDETLKKLSAEGWNIRQVYQEPPAYYRVFAQREVAIPGT
jgi:DNA-binding HxlR family transcriptional regulator